MKKIFSNLWYQSVVGIGLLVFLFQGSNVVSNYIFFNRIEDRLAHTVLNKSIQHVQAAAAHAGYIVAHSDNVLQDLQQLVDNAAALDFVSYAVVIDTHVQAIAHSDAIKLGKIYSDDYTIEGATRGSVMTSRFWADVQKLWTYDIMYPIIVNGQLFGSLDIGIPESGVTDVVRDLMIAQFAVSAAIVLFSVIFIIVAVRAVMKPIRHILTILKEISSESGDLTRRVESGRTDEIGEIAVYFNKTLDKIKRTMQTLKSNAHTLDQTSTTLAHNMSETALVVNHIYANIDTVQESAQGQAAAVTDTAAAIIQIFQQISHLDRAIAQQMSSVELSQTSIEDMAATTVRLMHMLDANNALIA
ncbi:MAG: HAMP domain-containing protein, partial [Treponema sp.]|nr:HAMP domain-containing protein [Treponema sp.]